MTDSTKFEINYIECILLILNLMKNNININDEDSKDSIKWLSNIFCKLNKFDVSTGIDLTD